MNDLRPGIPQSDLLAGGADFGFIADEQDLADGRISFECAFDAFDNDRATVVATHDIHCNSHN
jgi:hypothetical protein